MRKTYLLFMIASLLFAGQGCEKNTVGDRFYKEPLIESAKDYFNQCVISTDPNSSLSSDVSMEDKRNPRKNRQRTAVWDQAYVTHLSKGDAVVVPIHYNKPFLVKNNLSKNRLYSVNDLARLLVYMDVNKKYHAEVVTLLPDSNYTNQPHQIFSGIALVEDWSGNVLNRFAYAQNGSIKRYNPSLAARQTGASGAKFIEICYEMSGYNYSVDDPDNGYYWTEFLGCSVYYFDDGSVNTRDAMTPDYSSLGGGGGGGGGNPGISVADAVTVLPGKQTISNFKDYSKCFDNTSNGGYSYQVSVCVAQPIPGTRKTWSYDGSGGSSKEADLISVGHTFLTMREAAPSKTIVRNVGFYPSGSVSPYTPATQGALNNDEMHEYNISLTINLTSSQFNSLLTYINQAGGYTYNLNSNNCTTFALNALSSIGIELPRTIGTWLNGSGNNPGDFGEDLREMKLGPNMTRSTSEMNHANKGTCN